MDVNKLLIDTLKPLNIPVKFQKYTGTATAYTTFFEYLNNNESYADNTETSIGHYMQVDIWSKTDYTDVVNQAKILLKTISSKIYETEMYESDTQIYHKVIRIYIGEVI